MVRVTNGARAIRTWLVAMGGCLLACAGVSSHPAEGEDYGITDGLVWVRGPWSAIEPSSNVDDVIDQLCPAVMKLPRARDRAYGQEYCGVIYSLGEGTYYSSLPSPLGRTEPVGPTWRKSCFVPRDVRDPRGRESVIADFHSHPWFPSAMSQRDLSEASQRWFIRVQFDTDCHLQKLIPYLSENRPGEVYERRSQSWKLVGYIKLEDKPYGIITPVRDDVQGIPPAQERP